MFRQILYSSENIKEESNLSSKNEKDKNNSIIEVNSYESYLLRLNSFSASYTFRGIQRNVIHQNDPNSTYTFYFLSSMDVMLLNNILPTIMKKYNVQMVMTRWNIDIFFNEKIIPHDVLHDGIFLMEDK